MNPRFLVDLVHEAHWKQAASYQNNSMDTMTVGKQINFRLRAFILGQLERKVSVARGKT